MLLGLIEDDEKLKNREDAPKNFERDNVLTSIANRKYLIRKHGFLNSSHVILSIEDFMKTAAVIAFLRYP